MHGLLQLTGNAKNDDLLSGCQVLDRKILVIKALHNPIGQLISDLERSHMISRRIEARGFRTRLQDASQ